MNQHLNMLMRIVNDYSSSLENQGHRTASELILSQGMNAIQSIRVQAGEGGARKMPPKDPGNADDPAA